MTMIPSCKISTLFISMMCLLLSCKADPARTKFLPPAGNECDTCLLSKITTSSPIQENITISYNRYRQPHKLYYEYEHQLTRMDSCIYDDEGKLNRIERYVYPANREVPLLLRIKRFGYDAGGRINRSTILSPAPQPEEESEMTYQHDNNSCIIGCKMKSPDLSEQVYEYIYTAKDNPKSENYLLKGRLSSIRENTYDTAAGILNHPLLKFIIDDIDFPIRSFFGKNNPLRTKTTFKSLSSGGIGNSEITYKYTYTTKGRPTGVVITQTTTGKNIPPISSQVKQNFFFGG